MNKLIVIGWIGAKTAYLNISKEEAVGRYLKDNEGIVENNLFDDDMVSEFDFTDEFNCYDAWA